MATISPSNSNPKVPTPARRSFKSRRYKGGHDYEFVATPPANLECSICLLTLRDPMVVSCCGNHYCEQCIGRVKNEKKPCPLCNDPDYSIMLHKGVRREVNSLAVFCENKHLGCTWKGELGGISKHLDVGSRNSGCLFVEVECANDCGTKVYRRDLLQHEKTECTKKPGGFENGSGSLTSGSLAQVSREIQELREEKTKLQDDIAASKQQLQDLQTNVKSLENTIMQLSARVRDCEVGKGELVERTRKLEETSHKVIRIERQQMISTLQVEKVQADLTNQKEGLQSNLRALETRTTPYPPFHFTLHNFSHYQEHNYHWQSEVFYASPCGYKFKVSVYPNGISKGLGSHLSVYVSIIGGEYDSNLRWPFRGIVFIQIYNFTLGNWMLRQPIEFEATDSIGFTGKPAGLNSANPGLGFSQWIGLVELLQDYCQRGIVKFKVEEVSLT